METLFEDHLDFAKECAEEAIKIFLFDMPWNRRNKLHKNIIRINDWPEIKRYF